MSDLLKSYLTKPNHLWKSVNVFSEMHYSWWWKVFNQETETSSENLQLGVSLMGNQNPGGKRTHSFWCSRACLVQDLEIWKRDNCYCHEMKRGRGVVTKSVSSANFGSISSVFQTSLCNLNHLAECPYFSWALC